MYISFAKAFWKFVENLLNLFYWLINLTIHYDQYCIIRSYLFKSPGIFPFHRRTITILRYTYRLNVEIIVEI